MLNLSLKLKAHVDLRIKKARNTKARVKEILNRFNLTPNLTRRIHIAAV